MCFVRYLFSYMIKSGLSGPIVMRWYLIGVNDILRCGRVSTDNTVPTDLKFVY